MSYKIQLTFFALCVTLQLSRKHINHIEQECIYHEIMCWISGLCYSGCDSNPEWSVACLCLWKWQGWESSVVYLSIGKMTRTALEELGTAFPCKLLNLCLALKTF